MQRSPRSVLVWPRQRHRPIRPNGPRPAQHPTLRLLLLAGLLLCAIGCRRAPAEPQADVQAILGAAVAHPWLWKFVRPHAAQRGFVPVQFSAPVVYNRRFMPVDNFELPGRYPVRWKKFPPIEPLLLVEVLSVDANQAALILRLPVQGVVATFYLTKKETWRVAEAEVVEL